MLYYMDKEREHYPEQLIQGDAVSEDISKHAALEPRKADTTKFELTRNIRKRLEQIARDEGPSADRPF